MKAPGRAHDLATQIRTLILERAAASTAEEAARLAQQIDALRRELAACG